MKKGLGILLTTMLVAVYVLVSQATASAAAPHAVYNGSCGESIVWSVDTETGVLTLNGTGAMYDYVQASAGRNPFYNYRNDITSIVIGEGITYIGNYSFYYLIKATSAQIPSTVTVLGSNAFLNCRLLATAELPDDLTIIGDGAFKGCNVLASNTIPDGVEYIGASAFYQAPFTSIEIPPSVQTIGASAFYGNKLESVTFNEGLQLIGESAFAQNLLASVTIPASVASLSFNSFQFCDFLTEYVVKPDNQAYASHNGLLYTKDYSRLMSCPAGITAPVSIHESCSVIGGFAFTGTAATEVNIPAAVTTVEAFAFQSAKITSITIPSTVTAVGENLFEGCMELVTCNMLASVTAPGAYMFAGCSKLTNVVFSDTVTEYADGVFSYCSELVSFTVPANITDIPRKCFSGCSSITDFNIPSTVITLGEEAFFQCSGLTTLTIPNGVTEIQGRTFMQCTGLTSLELPANCTYIGDFAFSGCSNISAIVIRGALSYIGTNAFYNNRMLASATFHCGVPGYIGNNVFRNVLNSFVIYYNGIYPEWQSKPFNIGNASYVYEPFWLTPTIEMVSAQLRARATDDELRDIRFIAKVTEKEGCTVDNRYIILSVPANNTSVRVDGVNVFEYNEQENSYTFTAVLTKLQPQFRDYVIEAQGFIAYSGDENGVFESNLISTSVNALENGE